ncbi:DUF4937 domain-containing protein [Shewanella sp.]|nr:DUF4937 domain-containing protein [Shewanella sp.]
MIIKYICCQVKDAMQPTFSKGQTCWQRTADSAGFIAQTGGWQANHAHIFAVWKDKASIDTFMEYDHDPIAEAADQQASYRHLTVSYWQKIIDIPSHYTATSPASSDDKTKVTTMIARSAFIRTALCKLDPDNIDGFIDEQRTLWNPAMSAAKGMLGGFLLRSSRQDNQFLVVSFWSSQAHHQDYVDHDFKNIKPRAHDRPQPNNLDGNKIDIVPQWQVTVPASDNAKIMRDKQEA